MGNELYSCAAAASPRSMPAPRPAVAAATPLFLSQREGDAEKGAARSSPPCSTSKAALFPFLSTYFLTSSIPSVGCSCPAYPDRRRWRWLGGPRTGIRPMANTEDSLSSMVTSELQDPRHRFLNPERWRLWPDLLSCENANEQLWKGGLNGRDNIHVGPAHLPVQRGRVAAVGVAVDLTTSQTWQGSLGSSTAAMVSCIVLCYKMRRVLRKRV